MDAFLLAAGLGTRLKPFTDRYPKCLAPINGIPLLCIWIKKLESLEFIDKIFINVHYKRSEVYAMIEDFSFESPDTHEIKQILAALELDNSKVLLLTAGNEQNVYKSGRNIPKFKVMEASQVSKLNDISPKAAEKAYLLGGLSNLEQAIEIIDPYNQPTAIYQQVYQQVEQAITNLGQLKTR